MRTVDQFEEKNVFFVRDETVKVSVGQRKDGRHLAERLLIKLRAMREYSSAERVQKNVP